MVAALDTPMTELEAVNSILWAVGKNPIASLASADTNADAEAALIELRSTARELQSRGCTFNTEEDWPIDPEVDGTISLPRNTLKVRPVGTDAPGRYVQRGSKLYDKVGHTFVFARAVRVDLVLLIDFEDLPASARWLIAVRAARRFAVKRLGSSSAAKLGEYDERLALIQFEQDEAENDNETLATANPHVWRMRRK